MMRKIVLFLFFAMLIVGCKGKEESSKPAAAESAPKPNADGWYSLFDGKDFDGWKFNDQPGTFSIVDRTIKVNGKRSHLFYVGPVKNHNFKNFEFKADIMTKPGSNSGVYFHTKYQPEGWPDKGYEVQVNNSHSDWRRTGGLWGVKDIKEVPTKDNEWFTMYIKVEGKHIIVKLNGETVTDYVEPENVNYEGMPGRKIDSGTFALQGHDPGSTVFFKNIMVKPLP